MTIGDHGMPTALRARVFADLQPVRPLAPPWKRALVVVPAALLLAGLTRLLYGTRQDLGILMLWGASLLQAAVAVALAVAALREVIPDRKLTQKGAVALFALGFGGALVVTMLAWHESPTVAPPSRQYVYWLFCLRHTIVFGLPALAILLALAARGALWRPGLVGTLAGLSAGLLADAGWRTFCSVSEPRHVLTSHFAGVVALVLIGGVAANVVAFLRRPR
ncbi:MAG: NrsF family protein [Bacteroidales bacterium]